MNIKKYILLFLLLLPALAFVPRPLDAQTASEVDAMLHSDTVSAAAMARFVLGAADLLPQGLSGTQAEKAAFDLASSNGWIKTGAGENATLKDTAFLAMKAFDLKGGAFYSLFKNPRYAYREMVYQKLITGHADQNMRVTGARLLLILDKTISFAERQGGTK